MYFDYIFEDLTGGNSIGPPVKICAARNCARGYGGFGPQCLQALRSNVDGVHHRNGPTWTNVGDMRNIGCRTAADDRMINNGAGQNAFVSTVATVAGASSNKSWQIYLESEVSTFMQEGMDEEEALKFSIMVSEDSYVAGASMPPPPPVAAATLSSYHPAYTPDYIVRTRNAALAQRRATDKKDKRKRQKACISKSERVSF